jgi:hypothetical protein
MVDELGGELIRDRLWFDDGFTTIPNTWARDPMIHHQARGLLVQIASHKAGFRITLAQLQAGCLNGREALRSMLDELQRAGYLSRSTYRDGNLKRYRYRLRDPHAPHNADGQGEFQEIPRHDPPGSDFPATGFPTTGNRSTENPTRIRTLSKNKDLRLTETTTEDRPQPVDNLCPGTGNRRKHFFMPGSRYCMTCGTPAADEGTES